MRIAVANNFFPPRVGGSAHLSQGLARRYAEAGHDVVVITGAYGGAPAHEDEDGYTVHRLPGWTLPKTRLSFNFDINLIFTPGNLRRLWRILDEFRPNVIHQHGQFFDLTLLTAIYARRRGIPTVVSVHTRLEHTGRLANLVLAALDHTVVRAFVAIGRPHMVAMDKLMYRYIARRYRVPHQRIAPIPIGIDPNLIDQPIVRDVRTEFDLGDGPVILSLGHVIPIRNRMALVEAMPMVMRDHPGATLMVVGNTYDERFLERARQLGIDGHIRVAGPVSSREITSFLAVADVDAHDLSGYGLGIANFEAMAAGVPVIAAVDEDNFMGAELRSWENVVLVPPDNPDEIARAIQRLVTDRRSRERVIRGQRDLVDGHFTLEGVAETYVKLFEHVLATARN